MAIQGKKINELDSISTVTDATVFPAVRVEGSATSSTATKVSISQLKENLQEDIYTKEQVETLVGQKQDTLTAGANITIEEDSDENLVISADVDPLPSQTGNSGKFLTTNGSSTSWAEVDALPSQTGQSGKFLKTDGTNASWATVDTLPSQTGNSGKFLTTNGTTASWGNALQNTATQINSLTILGDNNNTGETVNIGLDSKCLGPFSIAAGKQSLTYSGGTSFGYSTKSNESSVAVGSGSLAGIDYFNTRVATWCIAVGRDSEALGNYAIAIGSGAKASAASAIQLDYGTNSTANSFQVKSYQLLNTSTGKIPNDRLSIDGTTIINDNGTLKAVSSGGGAPTLTWYKNNTGTTITIADTSSASLVKVYKNGLLLEPDTSDSDESGNDYLISGTTLTLTEALVSTDKICVEVF